MNIVDILIGFVGGGAIGGGALYVLQQGKIREALEKYEKIQAALGETEAELKDTKGQLKLLDLSEERMGNIEATYREEVAKLQKELEDSQGRLQEAASANPDQAVEVAYKTQIQQLQQEYEAKIEELRQSYQSQIQEMMDGKQAEMEALRQSQQTQILELENGYQSQIQQREQGYQSQPLELENARQAVVDDRTPEIVEPWDDFPDHPSAEIATTAEDFISEPEFAPETAAFGSFETMVETPVSESEMSPFDGFVTEETVVLEPEFTPEMLVETPVSESEMSPFDGFVTEETVVLEPEFTPEMEVFGGFETLEGHLELEPEFAPAMETFDGLNAWEETLVSPEMTIVEDSPVMEEQAISNLEISAAEMEFLNGVQLEEEIRTISSLEELSGNKEEFADAQNSLDDLFADIADSNSSELFDPFADPFAEETPKVEAKGKNGSSVLSNQEEPDFFSMLDNEEMGNLESLPSDEELPLDDLFSDDLFSDGDNSKTTKLESHQ
jgi:flagellar biosynthesis GTPase FlhF